MANRQFRSQFQYGFEGMVVELYAQSPTALPALSPSIAANSKGIASVSRTSAGLYVITLQDSYNKLLHLMWLSSRREPWLLPSST
jgi:hypothetical protein